MGFKDLIQPNLSVPDVRSDVIFEFFNGFLVLTNSTLMIMLILVAFAVFAVFIVRKFSIQPKLIQSYAEMIYEGILSLTDSITGSRKHSKYIFPVVATLVIYISVANSIGLIPGITSVTYSGVSFFRAPMSDFNTTLGLAFAIVVALQVISISEWGVLGYLSRFFQFHTVYKGFKQGFRAGIMSIIEFVIGLLDIVSEVAKVVSLSFRLFGNVFASEILLAILLGAVAYVIPSVWMAMSLLTGIIQAIVFGALTAAYYSFAIKPDDDELIAETE